jgi:phosphopentomutase
LCTNKQIQLGSKNGSAKKQMAKRTRIQTKYFNSTETSEGKTNFRGHSEIEHQTMNISKKNTQWKNYEIPPSWAYL